MERVRRPEEVDRPRQVVGSVWLRVRASIAGSAHRRQTLESRDSGPERGTIYLLKPHGSINWQLPPAADGEIVLKQRLHHASDVTEEIKYSFNDSISGKPDCID
jgi:hypothetical protein